MLSRSPLVSVVIIFLDAERFIGQAIASVFAQSYRSWELVLVDDGSCDGSTALAREWAALEPERVRYVEHDGHRNLGMSASRNAGVRASHGAYVAFLDADDVWLPNKLECQVEILEGQRDAALVYGRTPYWYSWTADPADRARDWMPALGVEPDTLVAPPTLLTLALASRAPTPCPSDFLVRRESYDRAGGFDETVPALFEDQAFLAKVYVAEPVFVSSETWFRYRQHADSCVARSEAEGRKYAAGLVYLAWLKRQLAERGVRDEGLLRALGGKRRRYRQRRLASLLRGVAGRSSRPVPLTR